MHLATFRGAAGETVGIVEGETVFALPELLPNAPRDMIGVISAGAPLLAKIGAALPNAKGVALSSVELLPPLPRPGKILCLGLNYALHAKEGGNPIPDYPSLFVRVQSSIVAPNAPVIRPKVSDKLDYECELTIVIGKTARNVPEDKALDYVFGYTIMNDVSVRDYQRKTTQWTAGKNFDGTGPLGPVIATADSLPPGASGLRIATRLNGETMQDSDTSDMIFSTARTVSLLSDIMTLEPGDVIATGTPSGVGYARKPPVWMKPGDVVEVEVEGIGILRNPIESA
ncbi:5-oxopent-3-ene-1,2,5-tricarboxylate decarboxylase [Terrihabitans soli]|uniref:5-oxopent-3-ene-1,2,5-tricarboxylate decarboxylase n=1 Tax=Terrihabitans soli TaxID=708113 RepID=A0A6S6QRQ5_9HYPH|nr:fumarylacetoacetate hydrolase family protein [Terrihabitans soli]BCJ89952.1 5-oxopent-3-ene-1,2,5-tricarboxylate decarboxylase [Terrihabitans soli]